jgi:hypothetical protein
LQKKNFAETQICAKATPFVNEHFPNGEVIRVLPVVSDGAFSSVRYF